MLLWFIFVWKGWELGVSLIILWIVLVIICGVCFGLEVRDLFIFFSIVWGVFVILLYLVFWLLFVGCSKLLKKVVGKLFGLMIVILILNWLSLIW